MVNVEGKSTARFEPVRAALAAHLASGEELGASVAVDVDGVMEVDLWGGHADEARTVPWEQDTLVSLWSTTKTLTSLAALVLVDRGALDLDRPVAYYWPEFAARGKQDIEVRHVLAHTSGLSGWQQPFTMDDLYDRPAASARLAAQAPWWEPGTASGYHVQTQGQLVGELVRRVRGRTLTEFVDTEIAKPSRADVQIGARQADWPRIAPLVAPAPLAGIPEGLDPEGLFVKTLLGSPARDEHVDTPRWRRAELGAVNGHGNARGLARALSVISRRGEVNGVRLLSEETVDKVLDVQADGVDLFLGVPVRWGVGFALADARTMPHMPTGRVCFWVGRGGSIVMMDLDRRVTFSYTMNRLGDGILGSERTHSYLKHVYEVLDSTR
ncbi:serine hydrolase domain-containing protein [Streptomyces candidus]|uniref:CubicO group peptidase (Beta-lactamase class C family) n=1 Tax=Streptomyces candidus TaxID=67283 RepID=A0A7X0LNC0_9ACTN|nr:serine hydrolase domain-containing protein [Streptomyces candidus]MBB6434324.1 CubicO group peptidase (beta-lactamase class C family) [Streptomyces candidus]GHH37084.1 EstA family serine hydrolase [Streptomyces candidus]